MFSKIFKILKDSVSSVTRKNQWELITKDLIKQEITGYRPTVRNQPIEYSPRFVKGQLVAMRYHQNWPHLHKEIGIILEVCDYDTMEKMGTMYFYEVLVGDEKITVLERYLDDTECSKE